MIHQLVIKKSSLLFINNQNAYYDLPELKDHANNSSEILLFLTFFHTDDS
jgi:hypothetical protein